MLLGGEQCIFLFYDTSSIFGLKKRGGNFTQIYLEGRYIMIIDPVQSHQAMSFAIFGISFPLRSMNILMTLLKILYQRFDHALDSSRYYHNILFLSRLAKVEYVFHDLNISKDEYVAVVL